LVANAAIAALHRTPTAPLTSLAPLLIAPHYRRHWIVESIDAPRSRVGNMATPDEYDGFRVERRGGGQVAHLMIEDGVANGHSVEVTSENGESIRAKVDAATDGRLRLMNYGGWMCVLLSRTWATARAAIRRGASAASSGSGGAPPIGFRLASRLRQLVDESAITADSLRTLLANLHALRHTSQRDEPVVILLYGRTMRLYLRVLSRIGWLPRLDVIAPRDGQELRARLEELDRSGRHHRIIVTRDLYFRHHSLFPATASGHSFQIL
jgi:hypothetical protein